MQITSVTQVLNQHGLATPQLRVLVPNRENDTALLLQPQGDIEADSDGVRNAVRDRAKRQFGAFVDDAIKLNVKLNADLAITPEYSMPRLITGPADYCT